MKFNLFPQLTAVDWEYWERCFPDGVGSSIFSAPAWQRLMDQEHEPGWQLRFLRGKSPKGQNLTIPVFVRKGHWGRVEMLVQPRGYYVTPIEDYPLDMTMAQGVLDAACSPFTAGLTWWLPPWGTWQPTVLARAGGIGQLDLNMGDTYVIPIQGTPDEHLARRVSKTLVRHLRTSLQRGLEVIENPTDDQVGEYHQLYQRVWEEEGWIGPPFSRQFFQGVAATLGEGGRLVLMTHQGRVVGGGVVLFDRYAVNYFQGAIDREDRQVYPHCVLYSRLLQYAHERKLPCVNLGGVNPGNHGLVRFKQSWGAVRWQVPSLRWRYEGSPALRKSLRFIRRTLRARATEETAVGLDWE